MADEYAPGVNVGNPSGYIGGLINEGVNATQGLAQFRAEGGAIRTESWFQLYGEATDAYQSAADIAGLDPYQLPDPSLYGEQMMGRGGQYASTVRVFIRDRSSGVVGSTYTRYITDDPHTPAEAEANAYADYTSEGNEDQYANTVLGTMTVRMAQTTPWVRG